MDEKIAIQLLRRYSPNREAFDKVLSHSTAVQKLALEIAEKINNAGKAKVDIEFVRTASLLHDIGRFVNPPGKDSMRHGIAGAEIMLKEDPDKRYALVCERHLGAGITKKDIIEKKLSLPPKDYVPLSVEEKIIAHADNLLWGKKVMPIETVIDRFTKEIDEETGKRIKKLSDEIESLVAKKK